MEYVSLVQLAATVRNIVMCVYVSGYDILSCLKGVPIIIIIIISSLTMKIQEMKMSEEI